MRPVDQAFPVAAFLQGEAHRGAADAKVTVPVVFLGKPAIDQAQIEAAGKGQVGAGSGERILLGGRGALAPVVEQILEQFLYVPHLAALALAAALDEPGLVLTRIQLPLAAGRAFTLAQVVGASDGAQAVVALQPAQHLGADLSVHALHARTCLRSSRAVRFKPAM